MCKQLFSQIVYDSIQLSDNSDQSQNNCDDYEYEDYVQINGRNIRKTTSDDHLSFQNTLTDESKKDYNLFSKLSVPKDFFQSINQNQKRDTFCFQNDKILQESFAPQRHSYNVNLLQNSNLQLIQQHKSILKINQDQNQDTQDNILLTQKQQSYFEACENQDETRYVGFLKFFDERKKYGFIEDDSSDVFVHQDDLLLANLKKSQFKVQKQGKYLRLKFNIFSYIGKHSHSRKAVNIEQYSEEPQKTLSNELHL